MTRSALSLLALAVCLSCFFLVTNGTARPAGQPRTVEMRPVPTRVLMIGDSLSAGPFGEAIQQHLAQVYGPQNVAAYAACGSSPEHWLASERGFYTKCGYRESTPDQRPIYTEGGTGRRYLTPKLETLVKRYRPTVVVVQLGTNWMDRDLTSAQISTFADRFIRAARGPSVRQIIWLAPPDSSAMRRTAQNRIHELIQQAAKRDRFEVIDSRQMTRYIRGKTGSDGVHYNSEASRAWAAKVNPALDAKLRGQLARNR